MEPARQTRLERVFLRVFPKPIFDSTSVLVSIRKAADVIVHTWFISKETIIRVSTINHFNPDIVSGFPLDFVSLTVHPSLKGSFHTTITLALVQITLMLHTIRAPSATILFSEAPHF